MKKTVFLKTCLTKAIMLILVLFLSNCQEREDPIQENNHTASEIHKVKVNDYWNQLKLNSNEEQLSIIEELSTAIDINSLKIYDLRTTEKLLIADAKSLQGLDGITKVIFYLNENKIVRSNIVTLKTNETNRNYDNVISAVLNADKIGFNYSGEITFLSLSKTKLLYNKYDQGKIIENATLSPTRKGQRTGKTQASCVEYWYIIRYGGEIISQVLLFTICDCSGGGGGGGEEASKMSNCDNGGTIFLGGSGASSSTSYKPNLPLHPVQNQVYRFTDPDGVSTDYIFNTLTNSWQILQVMLPNIIIANNRDNYGILDYQFPVNNQKVFDPNTRIFYTYEQGSDSWIGIPATNLLIAQDIEKRIDDSQLDPCPKAVLNKLKNATNCDIANVFTKLNANNVYNVNIISGDAGNKPAYTSRSSKNNFTTILNNKAYTSSTQLYKAANILHEITHAFFLTLVEDYYGSDNPAVFNEFPVLFQAYVNIKYPQQTEDKQHLEMANNYVEAIGAALQEFQTGVSLANGVKPDQIYTDLAWGGLREAPIYEKTFPTGTAERLRIDNRLAAEQTGHAIGEGTAQQQTPMGKPCN
ncbi:hypothetical protein [Flavobacterium araucananum]|uniref:Uncharacterized protein n=1 Tax=Flavobacterium araucananum TaxID=946678 RepID=A0A227NT51_9FLAO|nr:hypothetical protein [Flavobacterium araucananum]OXG00005.1 hypothetical protein B0A64_20820 [Flavobacterium araucananum]